MKKKMLQVTNVDFTVEKLLYKLIKESENEYDVHVACVAGEHSKRLEKEGMNFKYINLDRKINPISNLKTMYQLYKIIKKGKYDIVHFHTPVVSILGRIAAKLAKAPNIIYTAHGFYFHDEMRKSAFKSCVAIEKFIGRYFTDYIFTQSYEDYEFACENKFNNKDNIICISNGINLNKYRKDNLLKSRSEMRKEFDIPNDSKVICFVGRLVKEKGILDLLEAFKDVVKENKNTYLIVVGDNVTGDRDTTFKKSIDEILNEKNVFDKIRLLGLRSDIPEILNACDIFALPSYREGMPRSIIEAMAMGKAIIATNIRGCREEVIDGENGFLVPTKSPKSIKDKINVILNDNELLKSMQRKSFNRAINLYDEEKVVQKQIDIFKGLRGIN